MPPAEHLTGVQSCPACGGAHRLVDCPTCFERSLVGKEAHLAQLPVGEAFEIWFAALLKSPETDTSVRYISKESENTYRDYAKALSKFFGETPLGEIHDGQIRCYQDARAENKYGVWKRKCGRNRIRKEVDLLIRLMKAADVWDDRLKKHFVRLPRQLSEIKRAIEPSEQNTLLRVMMSRPEWEWIYHYTVLALATCMSTFELRGIRLGDIDEKRRILNVPPSASKCQPRNRTIPLESYALRSVAFLKERARRYGAFQPEHHLFPYGIGRSHRPNPCKPMTKDAVMDAWEKIRKEAGLHKLRPYDMRHTAITRMAEQGVPIHVIMAFAGHISEKMQQHYVTISTEAMREISEQMPIPFVPKKPPLRFVELPQKKIA